MIYCLTILSLLFINHLLGHLWVTGMLYMTDQIMIRFLIRQSNYNTKHVQQLQELFKGPHGNVFTMSLELKVLVAEVGAENFVLSINYCQLNALSTFSKLYHPVKVFMIHARNRDIFSIPKLIVSNILSFQMLYLNGRNLPQ